MKKDNMDHTITMESARIDIWDFGVPILKRNQKEVDSSLYEIDGQTITFKTPLDASTHYEALLADSTKSENGFTFLFKGERKEVPTQQFRFTTQSDNEAMSSLFSGHMYLLTRLHDGAEIYRRPYDAWK